jgi:TM2 domain-containing membrane protein YozV
MSTGYMTMTSDKSKMVALILCILGGFFGLHYFYVGRIGKGLLYLCTAGLFGIGWFIDIIVIVAGGFKDNAGAPLRK